MLRSIGNSRMWAAGGVSAERDIEVVSDLGAIDRVLHYSIRHASTGPCGLHPPCGEISDRQLLSCQSID